jgi:hypothetical protein
MGVSHRRWILQKPLDVPKVCKVVLRKPQTAHRASRHSTVQAAIHF